MIEVEVESADWPAALPDAEALAQRAAEAALAGAEVQGDVVVLLTDDEAMAGLNLQFRAKAGAFG